MIFLYDIYKDSKQIQWQAITILKTTPNLPILKDYSYIYRYLMKDQRCGFKDKNVVSYAKDNEVPAKNIYKVI